MGVGLFVAWFGNGSPDTWAQSFFLLIGGLLVCSTGRWIVRVPGAFVLATIVTVPFIDPEYQPPTTQAGREATPPIPDPTAPEGEASSPNCDLTGTWTSVLYQLPGQPAVTDRLTFVHDGGNRYTVVMTYDDGSTMRESAIRDGCTLNETVEGNRYVVREGGQVGLSDQDGFIRVYRPQ